MVGEPSTRLALAVRPMSKSINKAVILAAGRGERLRPLTRHIPKPMLPINGRPLLDYLVGLLQLHGVREVAINLHHQPHVIHGYLGDGSRFGLRLTYSLEKRLLGSAGALRRLAGFLDQTFFVLYGDVLTNLDLSRLADFHRAKGGPITMALYREKETSRCGIAEVDSAGRVWRFEEKPSARVTGSGWAAAGVLVMEPWVLRFILPKVPCDLGADLFPSLLREGVPIYGYRSAGYFLDVGSLERYLKAQRDVASGLVRLGACRMDEGWLLIGRVPRSLVGETRAAG